jgi:hypothetical protein
LDALGDQGQQVASAHGQLLNEHLGLDGVNARSLARQAIFDNLLFGCGPTVMGYRAYTQDTPTTDPVTGEVTVVPVPIKTELYWEKLSPKAFLIPHDFTSTEFDKAPWLCYRLPQMSLIEAKRLYGAAIPEDFKGSGSGEEGKFRQGDQADGLPGVDTVSGVCLYYRTAIYDAAIVHPDHLTCLILIDGIAEPVKHEPAAFQTFDAQGKLTPDSLIGYPIHPLVVRTLTDAAYVPSDVTMSLPLVKELDAFREQMVSQRKATLLHYFYNTDTMPTEALEQATDDSVGGLVGLPGAAFADPNGPIRAFPHGPYPRENFQFNDYLDNDLARTHAVDATSSGTSAESGLTATEANLRQANVNVRLGWEQGFVADWFVSGATKFATLMQKFLAVEEATDIIGQPKAQLWDAWRRQSPARLSFTMAPDSSLRNDTPLARKQLQEVFTYLANDPSLNRSYLTRKLLEKFHLDPAQAVLPQAQVPQPKPAPPTLSLSFKGEDLNPLSPQSPIVIDLLTKAGVQIDPQAITNAMSLGQMAMAAQHAQATAEAAAKGGEAPPHGGKAVPIESMDKHQTDTTGAMSGSGQMGPA